MAPKLLSHVSKTARISSHPQALMLQPNLAMLAMTVIAYGSETDAYWSYILVELLGAKSKIGLAMYEAIISAEGKRSTILGASQAKLSANDHRLLKAVYTATSLAREQRNGFAHHLWGFTYPGAPPFLVLMNPRDATRHHLSKREFLRRVAIFSKRPGGVQISREVAKAAVEFDPSKAWAYGESDLREYLVVAQTANETVRSLLDYLEGPQRAPKRASLLSRPLVQLAHQNLLKNNTPKALRSRRAKTRAP